MAYIVMAYTANKTGKYLVSSYLGDLYGYGPERIMALYSYGPIQLWPI